MSIVLFLQMLVQRIMSYPVFRWINPYFGDPCVVPVSLVVCRLDVNAISSGVVNPTKMPAAELYREGGKYFLFSMVIVNRCVVPRLVFMSIMRFIVVLQLSDDTHPNGDNVDGQLIANVVYQIEYPTQKNILAYLCYSMIYSILVTSIMVFSCLCGGNFLLSLIN